MISATMPIAGRISTYTSGCARNQNRCCQSSGLPPPATVSALPPTTRPLGRKKLVPARRSISCSTPAASSGGNASSSRNDVTNCAQTKNGRRMQVRPFARSCTIVTMKLTEPSSDEVIRKTMPISHIVWPVVAMTDERRIRRPARLRGAARQEEAREHHHAADEVHPVAHHVELGERHVGRADLQRHHEVAEAADGERHDAEEHHDGAVHRAELVVELGQHDAARRAGPGPSQLPMSGIGRPG